MGEAIVKAIIGVAFIGIGSVVLNNAALQVNRELEQRKIWADASRTPEPVPAKENGHARD